MSSGVGITLIAVGAILRFAVARSPTLNCTSWLS